jgi:hypothetical protein
MRWHPGMSRLATCLLVVALSTLGCVRVPGGLIYAEERNDFHLSIRYGRGVTELHPVGGGLEYTEGDIPTLFRRLAPGETRWAFSTRDTNSYQVVHPWDSEKARQVVADKLGLWLAREVREVPVLVLSVGPEGHTMQPAVGGADDRPGEWREESNGTQGRGT